MLDNFINDKELLYRAVPSKPQFWKEREGRPSSAIFKDSKGVSVDRKGERSAGDVILALQKRFQNLRAIICLSAGVCREENAFIKYDPILENEHHSLILDSPEKIQMGSGKARRLARRVQVVFEEEQ